MAGVLGDINQNLMGLQALAAGRQEIEQNRKQIEDQRIASESLREYQRTAQEGNPNFEALSEATLRSPQLASQFLQSVGIADDRRGQDAANYALSAYQNIDNPDEFVRLTQNRINYLQQQGRDPSESVKVLEAYLAGDKENVRKGTKVLAASLANQGYLDKDIYASTFGAGGAAKIGQYNPGDYTPESFAKFTQSGNPGDLQRYENSQIVDIGGVRNLVNRTTGERTPLTTAGEVAGNVSTIKGAEKTAEKTAESTVKYKDTIFDNVKSNQKLINQYDRAVNSLKKGANSGVIYAKLPTIQEQSILVDVIRKEIGMEVLGSGLLGVNPTDRDVNFALETAIPDKLSPEALRRELERRSKVLKDLNAAQREYYRLIDEEGYTKGDILKMAAERNAGGEDETVSWDDLQ